MKNSKWIRKIMTGLLVVVLLLAGDATAGYFYLRNRFGGGTPSVNLTADSDNVLTVTCF